MMQLAPFLEELLVENGLKVLSIAARGSDNEALICERVTPKE